MRFFFGRIMHYFVFFWSLMYYYFYDKFDLYQFVQNHENLNTEYNFLYLGYIVFLIYSSLLILFDIFKFFYNRFFD